MIVRVVLSLNRLRRLELESRRPTERHRFGRPFSFDDSRFTELHPLFLTDSLRVFFFSRDAKLYLKRVQTNYPQWPKHDLKKKRLVHLKR